MTVANLEWIAQKYLKSHRKELFFQYSPRYPPKTQQEIEIWHQASFKAFMILILKDYDSSVK